MTVVNFLCRRENPIMKKKAKTIAAVSAAIISLLIIPLSNQGTSEPLVPKVRPVSAPVTIRDNTQPTENKALVGEKFAEISAHVSPPSETNFEPPNTADNTEILTESNTPRDNPTPSNNTAATTAQKPKMGDTRTEDSQKQVYFLGFGWIDDNEEPSGGIYAEDMYENGNKIGSMGGGTFVDGEGNINKMVGIMD